MLIRRAEPVTYKKSLFTPLHGLTGLSWKVQAGGRRFVARRQPASSAFIPGINRQREYRLLRKLAHRKITAYPLGFQYPWLLLNWAQGEEPDAAQWQAQSAALIQLLTRLHTQPPVGYRLNILALLWRYWQLTDPCWRHPRWLRILRRLSHQKEPIPLRLAPLHLDIHRENSLLTPGGLVLIDWEYAADGDVGLELCMLRYSGVITSYDWPAWQHDYAQAMSLDGRRLEQQIARWRPWVNLLRASWYSLYAQQRGGDNQLLSLAQTAWQQAK